METAYLKNGDHLYYKLETGKCMGVNTERKSIKMTACVPSIYVKDLQVISKEEFETARKSTGL